MNNINYPEPKHNPSTYKGPGVLYSKDTPIGDILEHGNVFTTPCNIRYYNDPFWYQEIPGGFLQLPLFNIDNKFVIQKMYYNAKAIINHYENKVKS